MFEECRLEGDFTLSSGRRSSVFYDFDLLNTEETVRYSKLLVSEIPQHIIARTDFIACPALGGIELGFLVAFALEKPRVKIDTKGFVRGPEFRAQRYLVIDDVISTYSAINKVQKALEGNQCIGAAALIFRGESTDVPSEFPTFYLARKEPEEIEEKHFARAPGS